MRILFLTLVLVIGVAGQAYAELPADELSLTDTGAKYLITKANEVAPAKTKTIIAKLGVIKYH